LEAAALAEGPGDGRAGAAADGLELDNVGAVGRETTGLEGRIGSAGLDGFTVVPFDGRAAGGVAL
jgi:hypothetical protein